jgi:hypothetical protein
MGMAYDVESRRTVLYGGSFGVGGGPSTPDILKSDTWAYDYDGNSWTDIDPIHNPGYRMRHSMVYTESGLIVMYGGQLTNEMNDFNDETWNHTFTAPITTTTTTTTPPPIDGITLAVIVLAVTIVLIVGAYFLRRK